MWNQLKALCRHLCPPIPNMNEDAAFFFLPQRFLFGPSGDNNLMLSHGIWNLNSLNQQNIVFFFIN